MTVNAKWTRRVMVAAVLALAGSARPAAADADAREQAAHILEAAGIRGGLIVHVGCGRSSGSGQAGELTAALHVSDACLVHGLDTDPSAVAKARAFIRDRGLTGPVSVARFGGERLPYVDNLVNLLVAEDLGNVPMAEVMRVLAPGGVAQVGGLDRRRPGEGGTRIVKPRPETIDDWTHFLHGPSGNAVADDRVVGPPRGMQWLARPMWTRHHRLDKGTQPAFRGLVSAGGRLFYLVDEATAAHTRVPSRWRLMARDAFSGVTLWRKPLPVREFPPRLEQLWRFLVADRDRLYAPLGPGRPVSALDAATGEVLRTYPETEGVQEVIKAGGTLFAVAGDTGIVAVQAATGRHLWTWAPPEGVAIVPLTLAASDAKVFVKTDRSVCGLSAETGDRLWRFVPEVAGKRKRLRWPRARLIATAGVVLCSYGGTDPAVLNRDRWQYLGSHPRVNEYGGRLAALSADDGRLLWEAAYRPGLESYPGDLFVIGGLVWFGPDYAEARDLHTGEVKRRQDVLERLWTTGHHHRCYPEKATSRYILTGKRGVEMIDLVGENHSRNNWVRGTCRLGVTPCNGLLYAPPHSCGCYMEAKLYGFWALGPVGAREPPGPVVDRLQEGPAYGQPIRNPKSEIQNGSWPTYRHDPARSGSTASAVPADLSPLWRAAVGSRVTPPVVAGGRVLVADVDAHRILCLDAATGKTQWTFTAGGRVDSPPTIYRGRVLAGCADGSVYALRLSDGALAWRFLAAPSHVNAVAMDQVESLWPVHGSVLVTGGVAYAAAGRSSYLDGGIVLYGLDPATGKVVCTQQVRSEHPSTPPPPPEAKRQAMRAKIAQNDTDFKTFTAPDHSDAFSMEGARNDVLVAGEGSVYLRHLRFDARLRRQKEPRTHLFSTSSLLDGAEIHRSHWVFGTGDFSRTPVAYSWIAYGPDRWRGSQLSVPYGLMLACDGETVWGVRRSHLMRGKRGGGGLYLLFAAPRPEAAESRPDFRKEGVRFAWTAPLPLRPRAMVRAGESILVAGMPDAFDAGDPSAPCNAVFQGEGGGRLYVADADTGKAVVAQPLDAAPVWDGMAVAGGRLYVALADGTLVCLGAR